MRNVQLVCVRFGERGMRSMQARSQRGVTIG
jgi:hypothetical protein